MRGREHNTKALMAWPRWMRRSSAAPSKRGRNVGAAPLGGRCRVVFLRRSEPPEGGGGRVSPPGECDGPFLPEKGLEVSGSGRLGLAVSEHDGNVLWEDVLALAAEILRKLGLEGRSEPEAHIAVGLQGKRRKRALDGHGMGITSRNVKVHVCAGG